MICVQGLSESPDLEFEYADTDKWAAELTGACRHRSQSHLQTLLYCVVHSSDLLSQHLSELYSYTEGPEFVLNRKCFEVEFREHGVYETLDATQRMWD